MGESDPERGTGRAWLLGIATNLVRRHHRTEMRRLTAYQRSVVSEAEEPMDHVVDRVGEGSRLDAALARIDRDLRDVILLVAGAQLSYLDAAAALDVPIGTVRSRMSRARTALRCALREVDDGDETAESFRHPRREAR